LRRPPSLPEGVRFLEAETRKTRDHLSRHLTDGALDFTADQVRRRHAVCESRAPRGPCIHHFAIEVDDVEKYTAEIRSQAAKSSAIRV